MAKTISRGQYLQAVGLLTVGNSWRKRVDELSKELAAVLEEKDGEDGHCGDAVLGDYSIDELLSKLDITVEEA